MISNLSKSELTRWIIPLILIVILSGGIRLMGLANGLPRYIMGRDETDYFQWVTHYRRTGSISGTAWDGYPPALFVLLLAEEKIVDAVRGSAVQVGEYFLVARLVNVLFGALTVLMTGLIARRLSGSPLAGLLAALLLATHVDFIEESRLGTANPPWAFFTALSLWLVLAASERPDGSLTAANSGGSSNKTHQVFFLWAAFVAGAISMLLKYQTAPLLVLPFIIMLRRGWADRKRSALNFILMGASLIALIGWLGFIYGATDIVNTPGSGTAALVGRANPFAITSLADNVSAVYAAMGGWPVVLLIIVVGAGAALRLRHTLKFDWEGLGLLTLFMAAFFWIMSLFWQVAIVKWLPVLNILLIIEAMGIAAVAHSVAAMPIPQRLRQSAASFVIIGFTIFLIWPQVTRYWLTLPNLIRPNPAAASMDWLYANTPQGARVLGNHYLFYIGSGFSRPPQFHSAQESTLSASVEDLRARGYEYAIVEATAETLADPRFAEFEAQTERVAVFTGEAYAPPGQIIFRLPPLPKNMRYLWFGNEREISFRGFDLPDATVKAGSTLRLTLYWMSVKPTPANNIVFVHVWDEATKTLIAGQDNPPDHGNSPTWGWTGDMQFVIDGYNIAIPAESKPGNYAIRIGMYDAGNGRRLPITEVGGTAVGTAVELATITIGGSP